MEMDAWMLGEEYDGSVVCKRFQKGLGLLGFAWTHQQKRWVHGQTAQKFWQFFGCPKNGQARKLSRFKPSRQATPTLDGNPITRRWWRIRL